MHRSIISYALLSLVMITPQAQAQILNWKDNIPSSLQPFQNNAQQLANIAQDTIIIYAHPAQKTAVPTLTKNPNPTAKFTSSAIVLAINATTIAKTLSQYDQYVGLFPSLKSAKLIEKSGHISQMKYKVSLPTAIPILNFNDEIIFQHHLGNNSLANIVIDAPIPYGIAKFEWFSLAENKTLVTLTQWSDLNQPKGFLLSQILKAMPEAKFAIPSATHAFILESLRKKFSSHSVLALNAGEFPQPQLSRIQLDKLAQISQLSQQPVSIIHRPSSLPYQHGPETLRFVTSYQYYQQSAQQLQKWLKPDAYQAIFPRQIKKIKLSNLPNKTQQADYKITIGLGVISIPFDFKLNFSYPNPNSNEIHANGGDLRYLKARMQLTKQHEGSLFQISSAAKIDNQAPFLLRAVRNLPYHDLLPTTGANSVFLEKFQFQNKQ